MHSDITEENTCKFESNEGRIFDIVGTGCCTVKESDIIDFCPDCFRLRGIEEVYRCICNETNAIKG